MTSALAQRQIETALGVKTYSFDTETYYDKDYTITKLGNQAYCAHPKFDCYLVTIWGEDYQYVGPPAKVDWSKLDGHRWLSHNQGFDWAVFLAMRDRLKILPKEISQYDWHCTSSMCCYIGAPRALANAVKALFGIDVSKAERTEMKGKHYEDIPQDQKERLNQYALDDAMHCYNLWQTYSHHWPEHERKLSFMGYDKGRQGLQLNVELLDQGLKTLIEEKDKRILTLPWTSEGAVPLSTKSLKEHCIKAGIPAPISVAEDDPRCEAWEALYADKVPWVTTMREIRKANVLYKKMEAMKIRVTAEGRISFSTRYFGAHTGRWSGDNGFNVMNFHKKALMGVDVRRCIIAKPGFKLVVADFSQIEPRCLAWLCGDDAFLASVRQGFGVYESHARNTMGWTGGPLKKEAPELYDLAKARVLGLGYGCGGDRFVDVAWSMAGVKIDKKNAKAQVDDFRASNPKIINLWNVLEEGMKRAARAKLLKYEIELPSGRTMHYWSPQMKGGALMARTVMGERLKYFWGGVLTENLTQATAREVLVEALLGMEAAKVNCLFHIYDETVSEVPLSMHTDEVKAILTKTPTWLEGCPLNVDIIETDYYRKPD